MEFSRSTRAWRLSRIEKGPRDQRRRGLLSTFAFGLENSANDAHQVRAANVTAVRQLRRKHTLHISRRQASALRSEVEDRVSQAVIVDVLDQFSDSIHRTGIDVELRRLDDTYLGRVSRRSINQNGTTTTWIGRIRRARNMPSEFKLVVSVVDKAGNIGVVQEVIIRTTGRDRGRGRGRGNGGRGRGGWF